MAFSFDGALLATGGWDGEVQLWSMATGHPVGSLLTGLEGEVLAVAFSPDGALLATAGNDGAVRLHERHDPPQREAMRTLRALRSGPSEYETE
ncbi:WD40 repeat domain-containing protein [Streptomyces sp. NPDC059688]|uniref:WD40 repeat domain-containing protein n=1 Tax=Streptomyces sp. NPDC059688 TaxID=3346906 RepID=UPI0036ACE466